MLGSVLRSFLLTSVNSGLPMNLACIEAGAVGKGVEISSFSQHPVKNFSPSRSQLPRTRQTVWLRTKSDLRESQGPGREQALVSPVYQAVVSCFKSSLFVEAYLHRLTIIPMPYSLYSTGRLRLQNLSSQAFVV